MKVVLRSDVAKLGQKGDVVEVAPGYARNFLVPRGLAFQATTGAIAQAEAMRRARQARQDRDRAGAEEVAQRLTGTSLRIPARAGADGRLFGSVTAADIATALTAQTGVEVDRRKVHLDEPIRNAGVHEISVKLHADVDARISVEVVTGGE